VSQFTISCTVELLRLVTTDDTSDVLVEKVINIDQSSHSQTAIEFQQSVSKLSTESVGSRRELDANSVHDVDATQFDNLTASTSAVCIGH